MTDAPAAATANWPFDANADSAVTVRFSKNDAPPRFAVAYWSIRGLAAPIRMMLCAAKQDHTVYMYDLLEDGSGNGWTSGYFADKARLKAAYPGDAALLNLPYIVDQDEKLILAQTNACLEYLGEHCCGMMGRTAVERAHCAQLLCEIYDLRCVMTKWAYNAGAANEAEATVASAGKHLAKLEQYLAHKSSTGTTQPFLVGDTFSAPDFHLFEIMDQFEALCQVKGLPALLEKFPHLQAFKTGFAQLPYVTVSNFASCFFFGKHCERSY